MHPHERSTVVRVAAAVGAFALLSGCATHLVKPAPSQPVAVMVTNNSNQSADIDALGSGGRYALGHVPVDVTATLYVPTYVVASGQLRLIVHRGDGSSLPTSAVRVAPGDSTTLIIDANPPFITFGVNP